MSDFDDLVSAERRRLDERAAASAAAESARRHGELPEWQRLAARVQDLLSAAARHLRDADVPPVPVVQEGKANERLENMGVVFVSRTRIVGHRWSMGLFDLDAEGRAYPPTNRLPLLHVDRASYTVKDKKRRKARLRTGLAPDQPVIWTGDGSPNRHPYDLDPAAGVETGRIGCFGKGDDGTPLVGGGQPLEPLLVQAVARLVAEKGTR
ncbi:hypothetical protein [Actinomadura nitritigenes]|uniref:hypothetical protein n=1 Tax=Actinomadura nitritigenes TaxID=134602 RepID=UPI003D90154D